MDWKRIIDAIEAKHPDISIAKELNVRTQYLSDLKSGKSKNPGADFVLNLVQKFNLSVGWLLSDTEELPMMVSENNGVHVYKQPCKGTIPYYDVDVMAHIAEALDVRENPAAYVSAPGFEDCFACFPVYGNSMAPKISSGDIVCVSKILAVEHILWGEIYVIVTDVMRVVKTLHPGKTDECLVLRSINPDFAGDTILKKQDIKALYLVKGIISRIAM